MGETQVKLVTEDEFLELPESVERIELIDGEVVVSPSPSFWHQEILGRLVFALRNWARQQARPVTVGQAPLDVRFGTGRILQPDAFVLLSSLSPSQTGPLDRVPEICIEVLSGNRSYDRLAKRLIYAEAGVHEYWIVDPNGSVERWVEGLTRPVVVAHRLTSELLPGLAIELGELFERPPAAE
jgi:Uma2 family endonuclease